MIQHVQGQTTHARRGALKNAFRYGVDYLLLTEGKTATPWLLSRNRFNLWSLWDRHHGGPRGDGAGFDWFRGELLARGFRLDGAELALLTQPSFLGFHFNPVSFWIARRGGAVCAFIAEVNNTFGHRHCYFCAHPDFRPIAGEETLTAEKLMHVSPFQAVAGIYRFNFAVTTTAIRIRIAHENGDQGVIATLSGVPAPATSASLVWAAIRRPMGAARVVALIHWQAVILWLKRAPFRRVPPPPDVLVSGSGSKDAS